MLFLYGFKLYSRLGAAELFAHEFKETFSVDRQIRYRILFSSK